MNRKVSIPIIAAIFGVTPFAAFAGEPATQPVSDPSAQQQVAPVSPGNAEDGQGRGRPGQRGMMVLNGKEFADAMQFMQNHSKERYDYIEGLPQVTPEQSKRKERLKNVAALAALQVMRLQKEDPKLYDISVRRMKLEDEVFGLDALYHRTSPDKQDEIKEQLRSKVAALVDVGIEERQTRLTKLQATVESEQKQLDDDQSNKSKLIDDRVTAILNAGGGLGASFKPNGPGGGNGGPGPHHGEKHQQSDTPSQ